MRDFKREGVQPGTADEALRETYRNEDLSRLIGSLVGLKPPPTRKDDMLAALVRLVEGDQLLLTWDRLTSEEKSKVAQTAWSDTGFFDREKFDAARRLLRSGPPEKADDSEEETDPDVSCGYRWDQDRKRRRSLIELIMPDGVMSREIQKALRKFVPEPKPPAIAGVDSPPESIQMPVVVWNPKTEKYDDETRAVPVVRREMEPAALRDLTAVLRLVDAGKVGITEKNRWPTPAAIRQVGKVLEGGDYFPDEQEGKSSGSGGDEENRPGPIRAFAWPMLVQAGKLAQVRGARLELTKAGRAALTEPPHESLRLLWHRWLSSDLLDELRRINVIRGQTGKGKRYLTDPAERRQIIAEALSECPVGRWVSIDELSEYMRAAGHTFEVSSDPWSLYIVDPQYGSLGYEGYGGWNILQLRYLLCLLMEYAATLGLIDAAFIPPDGARPDYGGMWGTDDLASFSRYDGLMFLRLTPLGAYALGLEQSYEPAPLPMRQVIHVEPDLEIAAIGPLSPSDVLLVESFASRAGEKSWRLDPERILDAQASGRSVGELAAFLEAASGAELPEPVERFLSDLASRASALRDLGPARLIGCADPDLAAFIAGHPSTGKLCRPAGKDTLVVAGKDEASFNRALRKLGFVLRTSQ